MGLLRKHPGLLDLIPEELASRVIKAALAQLDRLAINLFSSARMSSFRGLTKASRTVESSALQSPLGAAVVRLTLFAQTGGTEGDVFEDITCVWEAAYSRAIDGSALEGLRILETNAPAHNDGLDIVMKAALARRRLAAGEGVSLSALAVLGDASEEDVRNAIVPVPRSTVASHLARTWLRKRSVRGF